MKYRGALHRPCHLQICYPETLEAIRFKQERTGESGAEQAEK